MGISNFLNLFDDVATILDDIAVLTKKASAKTVGLMGDDLAVNSEQMIGLTAEQEFPIVWKIFLGALLNKIILIPFIFALTRFFPSALAALLVVGGLYLCFEGSEKVYEKIFEKKRLPRNKISKSLEDRVKSAVKTDFILSIEILAIAASTMGSSKALTSLLSLILVGLFATIIIYGSVLVIIKLDDLGLFLVKKYRSSFLNTIGTWLIKLSPKIVKALGQIGTLAFFLVGGEILTHAFHMDIGFNKYIESILIALIAGFSLVIPFELWNKYLKKHK